MGRKYASLHIYMQADESSENEILNEYLEGWSRLFNQARLVFREGIVSIYDRSMSFETIEESAQKLSKAFDARVFFACVFDDDVFTFGLCEEGRTLGRHVSGDGIDVYELAERQFPFAALKALLPDCTEKQILELTYLQGEDFEEALQGYLPFAFDERNY